MPHLRLVRFKNFRIINKSVDIIHLFDKLPQNSPKTFIKFNMGTNGQFWKEVSNYRFTFLYMQKYDFDKVWQEHLLNCSTQMCIWQWYFSYFPNFLMLAVLVLRIEIAYSKFEHTFLLLLYLHRRHKWLYKGSKEKWLMLLSVSNNFEKNLKWWQRCKKSEGSVFETRNFEFYELGTVNSATFMGQ